MKIKVIFSICLTLLLSYSVIQAWSGLLASDGDTLDYSKRNELVSKIENVYSSGSNVGIGTSNPSQSLEVSGVVEASSFQNADATVVGNTAVFEAVTPSQASYDIDVFGKNNGTNQWYTIPFSIEKLDPDNVYDHTTYTFTAPATGVYHLSLSVGLMQQGDTTSDPLVASVYCGSASRYIEAYSPGWVYSGITYFMAHTSANLYLEAGQTCQPKIQKWSGGNGRIGYGNDYTSFSGFRVR